MLTDNFSSFLPTFSVKYNNVAVAVVRVGSDYFEM